MKGVWTLTPRLRRRKTKAEAFYMNANGVNQSLGKVDVEVLEQLHELRDKKGNLLDSKWVAVPVEEET